MGNTNEPTDQPRLDPFGNQIPDDYESASAIEGGEGAGSPAVDPPDQLRESDRQTANGAPHTQRDVLDGAPQQGGEPASEPTSNASEEDAPEQPNTNRRQSDESVSESEQAEGEESGLPSLEEELGIDPAEVPDHIDSPEKAAEYAAYWQQKASQAQQEVQQVREQAGDVEALYPVLQVIQNDPELMQQVEEKLQQGGAPQQPRPQGQPNGQPQQAAQQLHPTARRQGQQGDVPADPSEIERPEKPTKPDDYDPYEAKTDPESESAQYQEELAEYQEAMADYQEQVAEAQQRQQQRQQQQRMQEQQQKQARQQLKQRAMYEQGFDDETADEFIEWATSEESLNDMDAWAHAFRATREGTSPHTSPAQTEVEQTPEPSADEKRQQEVQQGPQNFPQSAAGQPDRSGGQGNTTNPNQDIFQEQAESPDIFGDGLS